MNYQEFVNQIKETLSDKYENTYKIIVNPVKKLNGVEYDGLVVCNPNRNISPTIYLNLYYHRYLDGVPFDEIISDIVTTVEEHMPKSDFDISIFTDFNKAKERIVYKLINYERNQDYLKNVPYYRYLDFALIFQCLIDNENRQCSSITIRNEHLDFWDVTLDDLYQIASINTPKLMPYHLENMQHFLSKHHPCISENQIDLNINIYILSCQNQLFGATCIAYDGLLSKLALQFNSDFIIIPSSVHEVLLIPTQQKENLDHLDALIQEVNETEVSDEDYLSNHAYYFSRMEKALLTNVG